MDIDGKGDSLEELKGLKITALDDDEDDEDIAVDEEDNEEDEDEDDDDDEEEAVILGFVEKPKHRWSLLRQQFPSKAGGVPVVAHPRFDIPICSYCGSRLCLQFQILPQLLYYFGVKNDADSLDWATIALYTRDASCEGTDGYKQEFAWVQLANCL